MSLFKKKYIPLAIVGVITFVCMLWLFWVSILPTTQRIVPQTGEPATFLITYFWLLAIALIIALPLLYYMIFMRKAKMQNIFLASAFIFGILFMFVYLPFAYNDETHAHIPGTYFRASALLARGREGSFVVRDVHGHRIGYWRHYEDWWHPTGISYPFARYRSTLQGYYFVYDSFFSLNNREAYQGKAVRARLWGQWIHYAPQVLGVASGKLLGLGSVATLYLGRIFALAAFAGIVYWAISITKFKSLFVLLGISPAILVSAVSFSYDTVIISTGFLFTAMVLHMTFSQESKISTIQLIILLALAAIIAPGKYIYFPLLFLVLLIPRERFHRDEKFFSIACVIIAGGITIAISGGAIQALQRMFVNVAQEASVQPGIPTTGLGYLSYSPQRFFAVFTHTFLYQAGNIFMPLRDWCTLPRPLWNVFVFPIWVHIAIGFMLLASVSPCIDDDSVISISLLQKSFIAIIVIAIYSAGILASMDWLGEGRFVIGIFLQPRYFLPIVPLLVVPFYNVFKRVKANDGLLVFILCVINAYSVMFVFTRNIFANW